MKLVSAKRLVDDAHRRVYVVPAFNTNSANYEMTRGGARGGAVNVISCNHEKPLGRSFNPPLTTMDVCASRIGAQSVAQLLTRLDNRMDNSAQTCLLEPTLVQGSSVAEL